jgi:hypothetical protein
MRAVIVVFIALLLAGCNELVDTDRFRPATDGGIPRDGAPPSDSGN